MNIKILKIKKIKYIQPDICKWGGFSEIVELAIKIKFYKKIYCPHFLGSGIGLIASAHLLSSSDKNGFLEVKNNFLAGKKDETNQDSQDTFAVQVLLYF